jgi:hypothetical protein
MSLAAVALSDAAVDGAGTYEIITSPLLHVL